LGLDNEVEIEFDETMPGNMEQAFEWGAYDYGNDLTTAATVIVIILIILIIAVIFLISYAIFKNSKQSSIMTLSDVEEVRENLDQVNPSKFQKKSKKNTSIRIIYRDFRRYFFKVGLVKKISMTSMEIQEELVIITDEDLLKKIRKLYLKYRYTGAKEENDDVKNLRQLVKDLKKIYKTND